MEHRGFGTGSLALIVTGHRLLGEAIGYALRLRAGLHFSCVLGSLDGTEATRLLSYATVVLIDEERIADRRVSEQITRTLRGAPVIVIARDAEAAPDSNDAPLPNARCLPRHATIDDLICSIRHATSREQATPRDERCPREVSPREQETISLICAGLSNREIAKRLGVSVATVKNHVHHILTKLHARSRWEVAASMLGRSAGAANESKDSLSVRR